MKIRNIKELKPRRKRIVLRVDYNVSLDSGGVADDFKIKQTLPTIEYLLKNKNKIVLLSHFGRPARKRIAALSLLPVFKRLKYLLRDSKAQMKFFDEKIDSRLAEKLKSETADIIFLENIRFDEREEKNDLKFAKLLSQLGDIYVNEAFASSHRKCASIVGITKYLPSYAGFNFVNEIKFLEKAQKPKKPAVAILGGIKVNTKLPFVKLFLKNYSYVLLGGAMSNTMLRAKGYEIGGSIFNEEYLKKAKLLLKSRKLLLPKDVVIADKKSKKNIRIVKIVRAKKICLSNEEIFDIGPETIKFFSDKIKKAQTILWNGTLGMAEVPQFSHGTMAIAKMIAARSSGRALGIIGGGEVVRAAHSTKMSRYYDFISTGGGAMLEFLQGKTLAGLKPLLKSQ
ncbi:phosphoglycerate kinase [Patescibacteria group bacterium]|nr:phosphoglycerate kinase [Patescibacteria group bacterium]